MRLFSQMTLAELQMEMEKLLKEAEEKKAKGDLVGFGILEQKFFMAKSYYIGTGEFFIGKSYQVHGHDLPFTIEYFNGVFAWGTFAGSDECVGFPVGMLS